MDVTVFTQNGCSACHNAMEYLKRHNVKFTEKNISIDDAARSDLISRGFRSTPVIMVGSETIVGFSEPKLRKLLNP